MYKILILFCLVLYQVVGQNDALKLVIQQLQAIQSQAQGGAQGGASNSGFTAASATASSNGSPQIQTASVYSSGSGSAQSTVSTKNTNGIPLAQASAYSSGAGQTETSTSTTQLINGQYVTVTKRTRSNNIEDEQSSFNGDESNMTQTSASSAPEQTQSSQASVNSNDLIQSGTSTSSSNNIPIASASASSSSSGQSETSTSTTQLINGQYVTLTNKTVNDNKRDLDESLRRPEEQDEQKISLITSAPSNSSVLGENQEPSIQDDGISNCPTKSNSIKSVSTLENLVKQFLNETSLNSMFLGLTGSLLYLMLVI